MRSSDWSSDVCSSDLSWESSTTEYGYARLRAAGPRIEGRAPRGAAQQKPARLHVAGGPRQIANTLEAEHRIIDVERDHEPVVRRIRRGCRNPGTEAAGFVYTLLQQLPIGRFLVVHEIGRTSCRVRVCQ